MTGPLRRHLVATTTLLCVGLLAAPAVAEPDGKPSKEPKPKPAQQGGSTRDDAPRGNEGNPGTIKIAALGEDTHEDNNPKPGCALRVDFYGFNVGTYSVRITAHAPTGSGEQLAADSVDITQPRKGPDGQYQTSRVYDLRSALAGFEPAAQGYHVKVTVTDPDKPGRGGKQKVAWLDCEISDETAVAPRGSSARPAAGSAEVAAVDGRSASSQTDVRSAGAQTEVLGVKLTRDPAPAAAPARAGAAADTLPFTGSPLGTLFWSAIALTLWGAFLTGVARVHRGAVA